MEISKFRRIVNREEIPIIRSKSGWMNSNVTITMKEAPSPKVKAKNYVLGARWYFWLGFTIIVLAVL